MSGLPQALDWIARSDEAVFAMDVMDRIVVWNRGCEKLLGRPASSVLGRRCADVLCGRDLNGNVYCVRNCPVALQAREMPQDPVNSFTLRVLTPREGQKRIRVSVFHLSSQRPGLSSLVHVLREEDAPPSALERRLGEEAKREAALGLGRTVAELGAGSLTSREQDILRCLAEAMPTSGIAQKLDISPVTVRNHTQRILQKLGVHSKLHAVVHAYRNQLI